VVAAAHEVVLRRRRALHAHIAAIVHAKLVGVRLRPMVG
jgi:hypothetical protein